MATRFFSLLIEAGTKDIYLYIESENKERQNL